MNLSIFNTLKLIFAFGLISFNCFSQSQYVHSFGGANNDWSFAIDNTSDGGYVTAGYTQSYGAGITDFYIVKFDAAGSIQWTRTIGGTGAEWARSIIQTSDGGYAIAGYAFGSSFGAGNEDMYIVKLNSAGAVQWTRTIGGEYREEAYSIVQTSDGGYAVAGRSNSLTIGSGGMEFYLVKLDATGAVSWTKTIGYSTTSTSEEAYSVIQTSDGGYVLVGFTMLVGDKDILVVKLDGVGTIQWTRLIVENAQGADDYKILQASDGGYVLLANESGNSVSLVKLDGLGTTQWTTRISVPAAFYYSSVIKTSDGGYAVLGRTTAYGGETYVVKYTSTGVVQWKKNYGTWPTFSAEDICQTSDGSYVIVGWEGSVSPGHSVVMKIDALGNGCAYTGTGGSETFTPLVSSGVVGISGSGGVSGSGGISGSGGSILEVYCPTLYPGFFASATSICLNSCINYTDVTSGIPSPTGWTWSFPGGTPSSSTAQNPTNICYNTAGTYNARLIVTNGTLTDTLLRTNYITVSTPPAAANNTTSNAAICETATKALTATPAGGTWSIVSGGGSISGATYTPAIIAADVVVTIRYTVAAVGGCPATTSDVSFTVNDNLGTASNATSTAAICEGDTKALSATPAGGVWSVLSGGGTISGSVYASPVISSDAVINVRYAIAANGACPASTSDVVFTVNDNLGTASNATSTTAICEGDTKALSATPAGGVWSVVSGGGTISGTTYTSPVISSNTTVTVRYTIAANGACPATTSDVVFTVNDNLGTASNATSTAAICEGDTKALTATPAGGTWSIVSGGGTISGATYTSPLVSSNTIVTVRYTIAAIGACPATTSDVAFTVNDNLGTASNTTSTASICESGTVDLTATPVGGTWSVVSGGGTISGTTYTSPIVSSNTTVTVVYEIAVNGACPASSSNVSFDVNDNSGAAVNTTSNTSICETDSKTLVGSPSGGTWTIISGGGSISGTTYTNTPISSDSVVVVQYGMPANGACPATTSDVLFTVNDNLGAANNTTSTAAICEGDTKSLTASPAGGSWSVVSGGGTILGTTYTSPSVSANNTVTVQYTISANGSCPAITSDVSFIVNDNLGTASNMTSSSAICEGSTVALTATPAGGTWSVESGGGTISGSNYTSPTISGNSTVIIRYAIPANGACLGSSSDVTFTVNDNPGTAINTTSSDAICEGSNVVLSASPAGGTWTIENGGGTITGTTYSSPAVTTNTNVTVRYTIGANGACQGSTSDASFIVTVDPSASLNALNDSYIIYENETGLFNVTTNDLPSSLLITSIGSPANGTASISGNQISYTSNTDFRGLDSMTYVVCHSVCTSSCSSAIVYIQVDSDVNGGGWILSPNGDGKDDVFFIDGLYKYQKNEIVIFNRWGDEIYSASPYKNDWNSTSPKDVVSGTYFFILKLTLMDNTEKVVKGFIHVEK